MKIRYRYHGPLFNVSWSRCKEGNLLRYLTICRNKGNFIEIGRDAKTVLYSKIRYSVSRAKTNI